MTDYRARLQDLLRELFQFDCADLDFGIYRIMNQRRAEIEQFIQKGLLDAVAEELKPLAAHTAEEKHAELDKKAREVCAAYGVQAIDEKGRFALSEFAQLQLPQEYVQLKAEVDAIHVSAETEAQVFNDLYTFFSRYYDNGDFVTKRRYSRVEKYAIPYNGEEVLLHWANRDQYYVKTADALTDFAFVLPSAAGPYRVRFQIAAADTEQDNVKGQARFFLPVASAPGEFDATRRDLTLRFEYRPLSDAEKAAYGKSGVQARIIEGSRDALLRAVPDTTLRGLLATMPADAKASLLERHLTRWTRKSTSDFFIHKDLRGFLERELDFYLKNEVMRLDDLDTQNAARAESYLTRLVVVKRLARRIIEFLTQIEEFQKKLFEKPKFVLESHWCVTLDRVPAELYPAIAANERQWDEWKRLFGVQVPDQLDGSRNACKGLDQAASASFSAHPTLTVDTALYDAAFEDALLEALSAREGGLTAQTDGLLTHGENFQALNLLRPTYRQRVKCIYIDPPYNTGGDDFVYKDTYQHSTWLAMLEDRLRLSLGVLRTDGVLLVSIDDTEQALARQLLEELLRREAFLCSFVWRRRISSSLSRVMVSMDHEYVLAFSPAPESLQILGSERDMTKFDQLDENGRLYASMPLSLGMTREQRPNQWYELKNPRTGSGYRPPQGRIWCFYPPTMQQKIAQGRIIWPEDYPDRNLNTPRLRLYPEDVKRERRPVSTWITNKADPAGANGDDSVVTMASGRNEEGTRQLKDLVGETPQAIYPKPLSLIRSLVEQFTFDHDCVLDFFAGSGTTAHAVINLNREDGGHRKYILVEQGGYFDTVLKPRIQKVIYAADWKNGKPVAGSSGSSHAFQYLRLESYEDALDNLDLHPEAAPAPGLFPPEQDDYLLKYFMDHETRGTRLNVPAFAMPFDYCLRVRRDGVETRARVDLVETANFLLGLHVAARRAYTHLGRIYRVVQGQADNQSVVVVWRNTAGLDLEEEANWLCDEILSAARPDRVYFNGDSHVPDARSIEAVFLDAMR